MPNFKSSDDYPHVGKVLAIVAAVQWRPAPLLRHKGTIQVHLVKRASRSGDEGKLLTTATKSVSDFKIARFDSWTDRPVRNHVPTSATEL